MAYITILNKANRIKIFIGIAVLFFLHGCDCPDKIPVTKGRLAHAILYKVATDLKKEKSLYAFGSGGGMIYEIRMLSLSFFYYKPITIEEGRELVIYAAQKLANEINAEPRIHPYLSKYPFPPTRTDIRIFVKNLDHTSMQEGDASIVTLIEGIIEYKVNDPTTNRLRTVYQETYEEGVEKLQKPQQRLT